MEGRQILHITPRRVNDVRLKNIKEDKMNRPSLIKYFPKGTTLKKVHKTYLRDMPLYSYAVALDEYIDYLEDELSSLRGGNELGVSDVAAEHGALHEVGKCNASGQTTTEPSATDVDGALGEIIDTENIVMCPHCNKELQGFGGCSDGRCYEC